MPTSPDLNPDVVAGHSCCAGCDEHGALGAGPFVSNSYHFGMLLGVADLQADQDYHRGKTWLHQGWQHGAGVVWGLGVSLRADSGEIVVAPGLAVNAAGREAYLDREHCVNIAQWFAAEPHEQLDVNERPDGAREFVVHITIAPSTCAERPVPAISEPCTNSDVDIAYSRAVETGHLAVVENSAPAPAIAFPKLRQLAGLVPVTDAEIDHAIREIGAEPIGSRAARALAWMRDFAADDVTARAPDPPIATPFPTEASASVTLAEVVVILLPASNGASRITDTGADASIVDIRVRPALVPTTTLSDLLGGTFASPGHAVGPRILADSLALAGTELTVVATAALEPTTVDDTTVRITAFDAGWQTLAATVALDPDGVTIRATLAAAVTAPAVRVTVTGTGPTPVLGTDHIPLAGVTGGPANPDDHGTDAVLMQRS